MRFIFIFLMLFISALTQAATPINGWYASLFGGYAYLPGNVNFPSFQDPSYEGGYDAGGNIGFKSTPMRYEGELTYLNANLKKFKYNNVAQTGVTGYSDAVLAMVNVYYDFPNLLNALQPNIGVGIGYGWVNAELNSTGPAVASHLSGSNSVFSYQAGAGITYNFAETYALNLGYRYVATTTVNNLGSMFQAHLANLGVTYRFDGRNYK